MDKYYRIAPSSDNTYTVVDVDERKLWRISRGASLKTEMTAIFQELLLESGPYEFVCPQGSFEICGSLLTKYSWVDWSMVCIPYEMTNPDMLLLAERLLKFCKVNYYQARILSRNLGLLFPSDGDVFSHELDIL